MTSDGTTVLVASCGTRSDVTVVKRLLAVPWAGHCPCRCQPLPSFAPLLSTIIPQQSLVLRLEWAQFHFVFAHVLKKG